MLYEVITASATETNSLIPSHWSIVTISYKKDKLVRAYREMGNKKGAYLPSHLGQHRNPLKIRSTAAKRNEPCFSWKLNSLMN